MQKFPLDLVTLISYLKKLPGVGTKTAERFAFEVLRWPQDELSGMGHLLETVQEKIPPCKTCGCLTESGSCFFCSDTGRDGSKLCLISSPKDAYAIESTHSYHGLYHVIEHLLSPLDGRHAGSLRIDLILERIEKHQISEVIIAFDSTIEGDTTALYIKKNLEQQGIQILRLSVGIPMGSNLEQIDTGTLAKAFSTRQIF
jgi:recombination protein RecR